MKTTMFATILLSLLATGCRSVDGGGDPGQSEPSAELLDAMCGCSIEGIGRCGNYIKMDGEFVVLVHPSLGVMEFCKDKKNGAKVQVTGSMVEGKYVADSYERVD